MAFFYSNHNAADGIWNTEVVVALVVDGDFGIGVLYSQIDLGFYYCVDVGLVVVLPLVKLVGKSPSMATCWLVGHIDGLS